MSYSIRGHTIRLTRGDSLDVRIKIQIGGTNLFYTPKSTDVIFFGVKKRTDDSFCKIYKQIPNDTLILHLDPEDTRWLDFGRYWYDVQLKTIDGYITTFITKSEFILTEDICYND